MNGRRKNANAPSRGASHPLTRRVFGDLGTERAEFYSSISPESTDTFQAVPPVPARVFIGRNGPVAHKPNQWQMPRRELTVVAAAGSERPPSPDRPRDRVDFDTEGCLKQGRSYVASTVGSGGYRGRAGVQFHGPAIGKPALHLSIFRYGLSGLSNLRRLWVTERYPPYSRLALGAYPSRRWVGKRKAEICINE